jgi:hypothetical protein
MTREQAKEMWSIVKAYADGKEIEHINEGNHKWISYNEYKFNDIPQRYRIKPEPVYKAFRNGKECLEEMYKHQPFGWIMDEGQNINLMVTGVDPKYIMYNDFEEGTLIMPYDVAFRTYKFLDGSPFGIKKEIQ